MNKIQAPERNASAARPTGRRSPSLRSRGAVAARLLLVAGSAARVDVAGYGRIYVVLVKRLGVSCCFHCILRHPNRAEVTPDSEEFWYNAYAAHAGDWGHWVVRELGMGRYTACKAVHTNMCPGAPPREYKMNEKEKAAMDRAQ